MHFVTGAGTINTINFSGGAPSNPVALFLVRKAGATALLGSAGNISGTLTQLSDDRPVVLVWDGSSKWRCHQTSGEWQTFVATVGATGGGTATGATTVAARYSLLGKTLQVFVRLETITIAGTVTAITIAIPSGFTAAGRYECPASYSDAGTPGTGIAQVVASGANISLYRDLNAGANWTAGTTTRVSVAFAFEVA